MFYAEIPVPLLSLPPSSLGLQELQQLGVTPVVSSAPPPAPSPSPPPPTRGQQQRSLTNANPAPPRPSSLILGAPQVSRKEAQQEEEEHEEEEEVGEEAMESTDTDRTVEGSSGTDSRKQSYGELEGSYEDGDEMPKEEPAVVSLEFGMARMTC